MTRSQYSLIFDLDGTLIDSAADLAQAANALLEQLGHKPLEIGNIRQLVGDGVAALVQRAMAAVDAPVKASELAALVERFGELYLPVATMHTRPYPEVAETLAMLKAKDCRMAVCTNKPQRLSVEILRALDLIQFFEAVVGGDVVKARKPDAAHLRAALDLLGADTSAAVMIGDGINDVLAAHAAGIPCLVLPSGYGSTPPEELGGDRLLASFAEIPEAVASLLAQGPSKSAS